MTVPRRTLTVNFERSITAGVPNTMEVAVTPLSEPNAPEIDLSLVGGTQVQLIVLTNQTNPVSFDLVPTDSPALDQRVIYRIAWRERFMGKQYTHDFVMPDADTNFADLDNLGNLLGGETYVQWAERGAPNGVAALNALGQVVDADGNPVLAGQGADANNFTASHGIVKVTTQVDGQNAYDFQLAPGSMIRKWVGAVLPASGNFGSISHGLGTQHVLVQVFDTASRFPVDVVYRPNLDGNTVSVEFPAPPTLNEYTAIVIG